MARRPRLDLPGQPQHIVQRGNNRGACFFRPADYVTYRDALRRAASDAGVAIHAYVLMTNHVHLLATGFASGAVSRMMQALGRRYVRHVNTCLRRTGTLWEGRFKSSLIDTERYLLSCHRYIELNPVRSAMVSDPAAYDWSSFRCNAQGQDDPLLTPHPLYLALGADPQTRQTAYRTLFRNAIPDDELAAIRAHIEQERALGTERFQREIEQVLERAVRLRGPGRPAKLGADTPGNVL
jgi:putative transposase